MRDLITIHSGSHVQYILKVAKDPAYRDGMECRHDKCNRCAQCEAEEREANKYDRSKDEDLVYATQVYEAFSLTSIIPLPTEVTDYITALEMALEKGSK